MKTRNDIDIEAKICEGIHIAYRENNIPELIKGYLSLSNYNFTKAKQTALTEPLPSNKLILWSLGILQHMNNLLKESPEFITDAIQQEIKQLQGDIKKYYIEERLGKSAALTNFTSELSSKIKQSLHELRQEVNLILDSTSEEKNLIIEQASEVCQIRYKEYLETLYSEIQANFAPTPCNYCVFAFGSIGSKFITPYSDMDFAILIEQKTPENIEYFRQLTMLVAISIIEIAETPLRCFDISGLKFINMDFNHMFKCGLRMDGMVPHAGKSPLGNFGSANDVHYELIHSPEDMLALQDNTALRVNKAECLSQPSFILGDQHIYAEYFFQLQSILIKKNNYFVIRTLKFDYANSLYNIRLKQHYAIKHELVKPIKYFINILGRLYEIPVLSIWDTLKAMNSEHISKDNFKFLYAALIELAELRFGVYRFYAMQKENIHIQTELPDDCVGIYCHKDLAQLFRIFMLCFGIQNIVSKLMENINYLNETKYLLKNSILPNSKAMYNEMFDFSLNNRVSRDNHSLTRLSTNRLYKFLSNDIFTYDFFANMDFNLKNPEVNLLNIKTLQIILSLATHFLLYASPKEGERLIKQARDIFETYMFCAAGCSINLIEGSQDYISISRSICEVDNSLPTLLALTLAYTGKLYFHLDNAVTANKSVYLLDQAKNIRHEIDSNSEQYNDSLNKYKLDSLLIKRWGLFSHKVNTNNKAQLKLAIEEYNSIKDSHDDINFNECTSQIAFIETKLAKLSEGDERIEYLESARLKLESILNKENISQYSTYAKYINLLAWVEFLSGDKCKSKSLFIKSQSFIKSEFDISSQARIDSCIGLAYTADSNAERSEYAEMAKQLCAERLLPEHHHFYKKINGLTA